MIPLPDNLIDIINDYRFGNNDYWKTRYKYVLNEINDLRYYVFTSWSNKYCNVCNYCGNELTIPIKYDEALQTYYQELNRCNTICGCRIISLTIHRVNHNYYNAIHDIYDNSNDDSNSDDEYLLCR